VGGCTALVSVSRNLASRIRLSVDGKAARALVDEFKEQGSVRARTVFVELQPTQPKKVMAGSVCYPNGIVFIVISAEKLNGLLCHAPLLEYLQ
jgi:hypothetical protein